MFPPKVAGRDAAGMRPRREEEGRGVPARAAHGPWFYIIYSGDQRSLVPPPPPSPSRHMAKL